MCVHKANNLQDNLKVVFGGGGASQMTTVNVRSMNINCSEFFFFNP